MEMGCDMTLEALLWQQKSKHFRIDQLGSGHRLNFNHTAHKGVSRFAQWSHKSGLRFCKHKAVNIPFYEHCHKMDVPIPKIFACQSILKHKILCVVTDDRTLCGSIPIIKYPLKQMDWRSYWEQNVFLNIQSARKIEPFARAGLLKRMIRFM